MCGPPSNCCKHPHEATPQSWLLALANEGHHNPQRRPSSEHAKALARPDAWRFVRTRFNFTAAMRLTMCCAPLAAVDEAFGNAQSAPAGVQQQPDAANRVLADPAGGTAAAAEAAVALLPTAAGAGAMDDRVPAAANGLSAAEPTAAAAVLPAAVTSAKQAAVVQTLLTDQPAAIAVTGSSTAGTAQPINTGVPVPADEQQQPTAGDLPAVVSAAKQAAVVHTLQTDQPAAIAVTGDSAAGTAQPMDTAVSVFADAQQQPTGSDLSAAVSAAKQAAVVHTLQTDQPAAIAVSGNSEAGTPQPMHTSVQVPTDAPQQPVDSDLSAVVTAAKQAAVVQTLQTDQPAAIAVTGDSAAGTAQAMHTSAQVPTVAPQQPVDSDLSTAVTGAKQAAVVQTLLTDQPAAIAVSAGGTAPLVQQQAQVGQKRQGQKGQRQQQQRVPQGVARAEAARLQSIARRGGFSSAIVAAPALLPLAALQRVLPLLAPSAPFVVSHIDHTRSQP